MNRREFCGVVTVATAAFGAATLLRGQTASSATDLPSRIRGLMYGTLLGDALGGPIEFQAPEKVHALPEPPKLWREEEFMDRAARLATAGRLRLRSYRELRPQPESYAMWNVNSEAGTITDDSRHKLILLYALQHAEAADRWPFGAREFAQAFLDWPQTPAVTAQPTYGPLAQDWLEEWQFGARWVLGERDLQRARPTERMWNGLATCCGQMSLLPVAALFPGDPDRAYRAAWELGFFDNGQGKDLNAALVAGLAVALVTPVDPQNPRAAWEAVWTAMRHTDPYRFATIRWTTRAVDRWLDYALKSAREATGHPAQMYAAWDMAFRETTKWEAQVPFVVSFGSIAAADYDPLAAWQLTQEWGWDTDSFAQLLGAFLGALYGPELFSVDWRRSVASRLKADHQVELEEECRRLIRIQRLGQGRPLVRES